MARVANYARPPGENWEALLPVEGVDENRLVSPPPFKLARSTLLLRTALAQCLFLGDALLAYLAGESISEANDWLVYMGGSILASLYLGRGPAVLACLASLVMLRVPVHYHFPNPQEQWQYPLSFTLFLFSVYQIANLSDRARREAWKDRQKGQVLEVLSEFSQLCSEATSLAQVRELLTHTLRYRLDVQAEIRADEAQDALPLQGATQPHAWLHLKGRYAPFIQALVTDLIHHAALTMDRIQQAENEHKTSMLEATQKLQSALINSLSHDLQTPLSSILGVFEALQSEEATLSPEQGDKLVRLGHEQSERLLRVVRNLLNIGKLEGGALKLSLRPLPLVDLVRSVVRSFPPSSAQRVRLSVSQEELEVVGDPALLNQLIFNLLDNALKFSAAGSPVELRLGVTGAWASLELLDEGCGILEEDLSHIFERFFRGSTPRKIPGSGLGLHISKLLTDLHRGELHYKRLQVGSSFQLLLPRAPKESADA